METVSPTTVLMLVLIGFFFGIKDSGPGKAMLQAVRPVVVGLLLWTAYDMAGTVFGAKTQGWGPALAQNWDKLLFVAASFMLLTFTKVNPAIIILGSTTVDCFLYC